MTEFRTKAQPCYFYSATTNPLKTLGPVHAIYGTYMFDDRRYGFYDTLPFREYGLLTLLIDASYPLEYNLEFKCCALLTCYAHGSRKGA
jgi:hypothetical protein